MENLRKYGNPPFNIVLIHGGPGAAGEMKPVAEELSKNFGVLEPLQTATSIDGQIQELKLVLEQNDTLPVILVGYSWGAWLAYILIAQYPELVKKLILVGSGPFEAEYTKNMMETRLSRLNNQDKVEAQSLLKELNQNQSDNKDALEKFGKLISKADSYDPIPNIDVRVDVQKNIYQTVWPEADELRRSGKLLQLGETIQCPVVAIHGDYDSHPAEGAREPLSKTIKNFKFILLKNCGHKPWIERNAKEEFYKTLEKEFAT